MNSRLVAYFSLLISILSLSFSGFIYLKQRPPVSAPVEINSSIKTEPPSPAEVKVIEDLSQALISVAESAKPAIVTVSTEKIYTQRISPFPFFGGPFDDLFGDFMGRPQERKFKASGLGSGVIINKEGIILTNNHVVADADTILIGTLDNRTLSAKVVGRDPKTDIAVLKVETENLISIEAGDSDKLRVGEIVLAVGSPMSKGLAHTVTQGIVSAVGRANVGLAEYEDFIQTDAAINPGNSGGALVNLKGELVGINTAIASQSGGNQGIGFAVPVNMAMGVMDSLVKTGKVARGWIGVSVQDLNDDLVRSLNLRVNQGALISDIANGSPADEAGLKRGDLVTEFNGDRLGSGGHFRNKIATSRPGSTITLKVSRGSEALSIKIIVGEPPVKEVQREVSPRR